MSDGARIHVLIDGWDDTAVTVNYLGNDGEIVGRETMSWEERAGRKERVAIGFGSWALETYKAIEAIGYKTGERICWRPGVLVTIGSPPWD